MPSTYAHDRFGSDVLNELPTSISEIIRSEEPLFRIGLHGPDILFYYRPLTKNRMNRLGGLMHQQSGLIFFKRAGKLVSQHAYPSAEMAYIYGYLCHFALDVACHGYIGEITSSGTISHAEIEGQFDRSLLVLDQQNPLQADLVHQLIPSQSNSDIISSFYPTVRPSEIRESIESMIFYHHLLRAPGKLKRSVLYGGLKALGQYKNLSGHIISEFPDPRCDASNAQLFQLYCDAIPKAVELITHFEDLTQNQAQWPDSYYFNFESQKL